MRTLYLDCSMGAAGDMLAAALLELTDDPKAALDELNGIGIHGVEYIAEESVKCGIRGTHMKVLVHGHEEHEHHHGGHHHSGLHDIEHILGHLKLDEAVRRDVLNVYRSIADAESRVHGVPVAEIHFHEVGALDAVADVCAVCLLMRRIAPGRVIASAVHAGAGQVRCAHGILPVPAPATLELLKGIPFYGGEIKSELCTPTGAALLKYFVDDFGDMPAMRVERTGYGMGNKDFERANCVRALLGETVDKCEDAIELRCNLDDITGEAVAFATERLFEAGALDVYTVPIGMKKSRPGIMLGVICSPDKRPDMLAAIFRHTTTLGVRETALRRYVLDRTETQVETPYGMMRRKDASGYGVSRFKYEYEDIARAARESDSSLAEVLRRIEHQQ